MVGAVSKRFFGRNRKSRRREAAERRKFILIVSSAQWRGKGRRKCVETNLIDLRHNRSANKESAARCFIADRIVKTKGAK
jgi:hypothetical protein